MFNRIAQNIEMSFDIPDAEKEKALEAKMYFEATDHALTLAVEHLGHLYDVFTEYTDISVQSVIDHRGLLQGRYSTAIKKNFNEVKKKALLAIRKLNYFSTGDNSIRELIITFEESIKDIEEPVNVLLFVIKDDYDVDGFRDKVIEAIDKIKKQVEDTQDVINDRIIEHIDTNIITKSWMHEMSKELQLEDETNIPSITRLLKEREEILNGAPSTEAVAQSLNPSDAQRMLNPNHMTRDTNMGNFGE
jgi:hypothetical protein